MSAGAWFWAVVATGIVVAVVLGLYLADLPGMRRRISYVGDGLVVAAVKLGKLGIVSAVIYGVVRLVRFAWSGT